MRKNLITVSHPIKDTSVNTDRKTDVRRGREREKEKRERERESICN
jgi:hypothetical protein